MKGKKILQLATASAVLTGVISANSLPLQSLLTNGRTGQTAFAADSDIYTTYDFESSISGWDARGGATVEKSSTAYQGSGALSVSGRTDAWNGCQLTLDTTTFAAGTSHAFSVAVSPAGTAYVEMMLSLQYTANEETQYAHIASASVAGGKWAVLSSSEFAIPAGASDPVLYVETTKGSTSFFVDNVVLGKAGCVKTSNPVGKGVGDLDGDGAITGLDLALMKRCLFDEKLSQPATSDVDASGSFDYGDRTMLQEYLLGKVKSFPTPPEPPVSDFDYDENLQFHAMPDSYKNVCSQRGKIVDESYTSSNDGQGTYAKVYLPYGYDQNDTSKKYNVFYLMHGGGENQETIFGKDAELDNILDHMIMNGDLEPTIVVTPTFNHGGDSKFYNELIRDLIPLVEGKYNTYAESTSLEDIKASRFHRGFGGFSMGSVTTWYCFLNLLDYVAYYMPLSGDCWVGNSADEKAQACVNAVKKSGYAPDEYFVFCATGNEDIAYPNIVPQVEAMKKYTDQFIYTSDLSKGNFYFLTCSYATHWWGYVVHYVYDILPYFFHES